MKIIGAVCALLTFCCVSHAYSIYSNIAATTTGSDHVGLFGPLFDSLTTDGFGGTLVHVVSSSFAVHLLPRKLFY